METKKDVIDQLVSLEKRYKEAERLLKYLEKQEAPKVRISEMKRLHNFIEHEFKTRYLAAKLADLAFDENVTEKVKAPF